MLSVSTSMSVSPPPDPEPYEQEEYDQRDQLSHPEILDQPESRRPGRLFVVVLNLQTFLVREIHIGMLRISSSYLVVVFPCHQLSISKLRRKPIVVLRVDEDNSDFAAQVGTQLCLGFCFQPVGVDGGIILVGREGADNWGSGGRSRRRWRPAAGSVSRHGGWRGIGDLGCLRIDGDEKWRVGMMLTVLVEMDRKTDEAQEKIATVGGIRVVHWKIGVSSCLTDLGIN